MHPRKSDAPAEPAESPGKDRPVDEPRRPPVCVEPSPTEAVEMGGEAPCQLPRFWDVEE